MNKNSLNAYKNSLMLVSNILGLIFDLFEGVFKRIRLELPLGLVKQKLGRNEL